MLVPCTGTRLTKVPENCKRKLSSILSPQALSEGNIFLCYSLDGSALISYRKVTTANNKEQYILSWWLWTRFGAVDKLVDVPMFAAWTPPENDDFHDVEEEHFALNLYQSPDRSCVAVTGRILEPHCPCYHLPCHRLASCLCLVSETSIYARDAGT